MHGQRSNRMPNVSWVLSARRASHIHTPIQCSWPWLYALGTLLFMSHGGHTRLRKGYTWRSIFLYQQLMIWILTSWATLTLKLYRLLNFVLYIYLDRITNVNYLVDVIDFNIIQLVKAWVILSMILEVWILIEKIILIWWITRQINIEVDLVGG